MKTIKLALLLILLRAEASAQSVGCFVDNVSAPFCSSISLICGASSAANNAAFGYTVGRLCDDFVAQFNRAEFNLSELAKCSATLSSTETNRQEWIAYGNDQAALAKRLRRACGVKCRRIK